MKKIIALLRILFLAVLFILLNALSKNFVFAKEIKVAVLPFQNITDNKEYNWIGQGFSETLISSFANTQNIKVVERLLMNNLLKEISFQNSGFIDKNEAVKLGKLSGSNIIVSGSYQIINNEISVNARFIDLEKGTVDSGTAYHVRGSLNTIFDIQEKVAQQLNNEFSLNLSGQDKQNIKEVIHSTESLEANKLYITARNRYMNGGLKGTEDASHILEEAIKIDPKYSLAYALLGEALIKRGKFLSRLSENISINEKPDTYYQRGKANLEKAILISPNLFENYREIGRGYYYMKESAKAETYLKKSLELKPDDTESLIFLGALSDKNFYDYLMKAKQSDPYNYLVYENFGSYYIYYAEHTKENLNHAINYLNKSVELNPYSWISNLYIVECYTRLKEFDNAIKWSERLVAMESNDPIGYLITADLYSREENYDKFYYYIDKVDSLIDSNFVKTFKIYGLMDKKNYNEAYKLTRDLLEKSPEDPSYNMLMSEIYLDYYSNCKLANYHFEITQKNIKNLSHNFESALEKFSKKLKKRCTE